MFGAAAFASYDFAGAAVTEFTTIYVPDKPNFLQVRTNAGVLLHRLDAWYDAEVTLKANTPGLITFSLPLTTPAVADNSLINPNEIWWYDSAHVMRRKFIIQEEEIDYGAGVYKVYGEDYLVKMVNEGGEVDGEPLPMTVLDALERIFDAQVNERPLVLGYIDPAIAELGISFPDQAGSTFLSMLNGIRKQNVGGHFAVDSELRFNWYAYPTNAEIVLNMNNNLGGYSEKRRSADIYNRVYVTGAITSTGRQTCTAPGYVEDTASQVTYGVRSKYINNANLKTTAACDAFAEMYLEAHAAAPVVRTFPVIDTQALKRGTALTDEDINETIFIGLPVKLRIPTLAPSAAVLDDLIVTNVTGVKRNLAAFAELQVTLGSDLEQDEDIFDAIASSSTKTGNQNEEDTQDLLDLINDVGSGAVTHITLTDCPPTYSAAQVVKVNDAATAIDYTTGGGAGYSLRRNAANTGIEWSNDMSLVSSTLSGLGTLSGVGIGEVTADGNNEGLYYFPDAGAANSDWRQFTFLIQATTKSNLGNPGRFSFGWVSTAGTEFGLWYYPPNGTANSDWLPVNLYSTAS